MSSDTNVILKYRRPVEVWVCPECETENSMLLPKCTLCEYEKNSRAIILKAWSAEDEKAASRTIKSETSVNKSRVIKGDGKETAHTPHTPHSDVPKTDIVPPHSGVRVFREEEKAAGGVYIPPADEKGKNGIIWALLIAIIIVIGVIALVVYDGMNSVYSQTAETVAHDLSAAIAALANYSFS